MQITVRQTIIFSICCLFYLIGYAQPVGIKNSPNLRTDTINKHILDVSKYRIYYMMDFSPDTIALDFRKEAQTVLLVGSKHTSFLDYNSLKKDSVLDALCKEKVNAAEIISRVIPIGRKIEFRPTIVKNYPENGNYLFQQQVSSRDEYRYVDNNISIDWTLEAGEKEIEGYTCKKATCSFRGRDYTAWYSPDIPISEGPYVFSGLPGLIMEIADTRNHYKFSLNGLTVTKGYDHLYLVTDNVVNSTRNNVRKAIENTKRNPASILKSMANATVSEEVLAKLQPKPYNPIELY